MSYQKNKHDKILDDLLKEDLPDFGGPTGDTDMKKIIDKILNEEQGYPKPGLSKSPNPPTSIKFESKISSKY